MCDCESEGHSLRALRAITPGDDADDGERVLQACEAATGVRPPSCPWSALRDPFVADVIRAHGWREASQLQIKYPRGVPARIVWGIEEYARALNTVTVVDMRADRKERELERERRELANQR